MESPGRRGRRWQRRAVGSALAVAFVGALVLPTGGSATAQTPPKATGQPRIAGTAVEGNVLTASNGSFSGTGPFNYTYRWLRCPSTGGSGTGVGCTSISGATFKRYVVRAADVGHRLRVRVTASNAEGSASEVSKPTAI